MGHGGGSSGGDRGRQPRHPTRRVPRPGGRPAADPDDARARRCSSLSRGAPGASSRARSCTPSCGSSGIAASERSVDVYVGKLRQKLEEAAPRLALHPHAFRLRLPLRRAALRLALLSLFTPAARGRASMALRGVPPRKRRHGSGAPRPEPFCVLGVLLGGGRALAGALHQLVVHGALAAPAPLP